MLKYNHPIKNSSIFLGIIFMTSFLPSGLCPQSCIQKRGPCDSANSTGFCCPGSACSYSQAGGQCQAVLPNMCSRAADGAKCRNSISGEIGICCFTICTTNPEKLHESCRKTSQGTTTATGTENPTVTLNVTSRFKNVDTSSGLDAAHIIAIVFGSITAMFLGIILAVVLIRRRGKKQILTEKEVQQFLAGTPGTQKRKEYLYIHQNTDAVPYDKNYEVPDKDILIDYQNVLGSGAYGIVLRGVIRGKEIAAKTVRPDSDATQVKALLSELKVMIYIGKHPNIVSLIGASTTKLRNGSVFIFMEFCSIGSLLNYLQSYRGDFQPQAKPKIVNNSAHYCGEYDSDDQSRNTAIQLRRAQDSRRNMGISIIEMLTWSVQIASGMKYLCDKKVIHADLATRNVLLNDKLVAKITDFGLSRKLYDYTNYVKTKREKLPWAWMAIECLRESTFSSQSDVWSFGITLWEIFSFGATPHQGFNWSDGYNESIFNGMRPSKPDYASNDVYKLMTRCWQIDPKSRPTFSRLHTDLLELSTREAGYIDLSY